MSARPLLPGNLPGLVVEPRDGESVSDLRRRRHFRTPREMQHLKRRLATRRERRREAVR